jgi:hypothetical protein
MLDQQHKLLFYHLVLLNGEQRNIKNTARTVNGSRYAIVDKTKHSVSLECPMLDSVTKGKEWQQHSIQLNKVELF